MQKKNNPASGTEPSSRRAFLKVASVGAAGFVAGCDTFGADDRYEIPGPDPGEEPGGGGEPTPEGGWAQKAQLPEPQSDPGTGVIGGKLYLFGGIKTAVELDATSHSFVYDPQDGDAGSWQRIEDMPKPLWGVCGVAAEGKIFSFGGAAERSPYGTDKPPTDEILKYTPGGGWENLTEKTGVRCPYPNWVMKGAYSPVTGLIYCVGGGIISPDRSNYWGDNSDRIWTFDPVTEEVANPDWVRMPEPKRWTTVALLEKDGRHYIHSIAGLNHGATDSHFRFDLETGEGRRMQPTPRPGNYATHENPVIDNQVYLSHGMFGDLGTTDRYKLIAHRYDPATDSFEELPKPRHRRGGSSDAVIDGTLYVVGGHLKRYEQNKLHDCTAFNEAFTPSAEEPASAIYPA